MIDQLEGKELKIESYRDRSQVIVVADGVATGGTENISDGFRDGTALTPSLGAGELERRTFQIESLSVSRDGSQEFRFSITDWTHFNSTKVQTGDRVTLSLAPEASPATVRQGTFPAEHSYNLSAKSAYFYGFVRDTESRPGENLIGMSCISAIEWSNEVALVMRRDADNSNLDVRAPKIVFNADSLDSPNWLISIKKHDASSSDALTRFDWAQPKILADARMNVGEILEYLAARYYDDLVEARVIDDGDVLFDPAELATLIRIPGETVFQGSGFGEAVQRLMNAVYPDVNIRVDPRTRQWKFHRDHRDMVFENITSITALGPDPTTNFALDDVTGFTAGEYLRVIGDTVLNETEVAQIDSIAGGPTGPGSVTLSTSLPFTPQVGQQVIPLFDQADRPPVLELDLESGHVYADMQIALDLTDCYTAVTITNERADTSEVEISFTAEPELGLRIQSGVEAEMQDGFNPGDHGERRSDRGADGGGIEIHEIDVSGGVSSIWFSENSSEHGRDHKTGGGVGAGAFPGEWVGTGLRILTRDGQTTHIRSLRLGGIVTSFETNNPPGGGGAPGERFYRIQIDGDIEATIPTLQSVVDDGTGDLFELTSNQDSLREVVTPNRRSLVGKTFGIVNSSTATEDNARLIDGGDCGPIVHGGAGGSYGQAGALGGHSPDLPRTYEEQVNFHENINPQATGLDPLQRGWVMGFFPPRAEPQSNADICARLPSTERYQLREFTSRVRKLEYEVTQVRAPATGFAGLGTMFNWEKELNIPSSKFTNAEVQGARYALIAEAWLVRASEPRYTGTMTLDCVAPWLGWSDLGFRLTFGAGNTGAVGGVVNEQRAFWALVETVDYDFVGGTTTVGFASRDLVDRADLSEFERNLVEVPDQLSLFREELEGMRRRQRCAEQLVRNMPVHRPLDCNVLAGQQTLSVTRAVIPSKQQFGGVARTQIGAPAITDTNYGGGAGGSIAEHPDWTIEVDYPGDPFAVSVPYGSHHGGSLNAEGTIFDPVSVPTPATPVGQAQHNSEALDGLACQMLSIRVPKTARPVVVRVGSGSTTTVIQLAHPIDTSEDYSEGRLAFFGGVDTKRPVYEIDSVTSTTITLASAMSETAPLEGETAHLLGKPIPKIDQASIPGGNFAWQDDANEWFVSETGSGAAPVHATLGANNVLTASGASTMPTIRIGLPGWDITAAGNWDFTTPPTGT